MKTGLRMGWFRVVAMLAVAVSAQAQGRLEIDVPGFNGRGQLGKVKAEVYRVEGSELRRVYQGNAAELSETGLDLSEGTYRVFIEDPKTGLIVPLEVPGPEVPSGARGVAKRSVRAVGGGWMRLEAPDFAERVRAIRDKDKAEKRAWSKKPRGRKGTLAVGDPPDGPAGPDDLGESHVPGDLLLKYGPATHLAERYEFVQQLQAEPRNKIGGIEVYRVRVAEDTDLRALIAAHADDPRVAYMELNQMISVPEPVEGDTKR